MRVLLQRVSSASVSVADEQVASVGHGLCLLVGVAQGDTESDAQLLAHKCVDLRIFPDEAGKMNRSLLEVGGGCLVVSQFTLLADLTRGRRPYFGQAERPDRALMLFNEFVETIRRRGVLVETGRFGTDMNVELANYGPVTIWLDSIDAG